MTRAIQQRVRFSVSAERLFATYVHSKQHSAATGAKATVSPKPGAPFTAYNGQISGRILAVIPNRMIVQTWRASHWKAEDLDSILLLTFTQTPEGGQIDLVHANVPQHDLKGVTRGWRKYYWEPFRTYFNKQGA